MRPASPKEIWVIVKKVSGIGLNREVKVLKGENGAPNFERSVDLRWREVQGEKKRSLRPLPKKKGIPEKKPDEAHRRKREHGSPAAPRGGGE